MVPFACMPSLPTPAGWMESVRSYYSIGCGLPRNRGGSAPALTFSRPAQRSRKLRPACLSSRFNDLLHQRLQRSRCLHRCSDCYRVERTSSRAGLTPAVDHHLFTAHAVMRFTRTLTPSWPIIFEQMDAMSKADALKLASKWERQNQAISIFCFSPSVAFSSKRGKVAMCLDECIDLRLADETVLRIFTHGAAFSSVGPQDFPAEYISLLPKFGHGVRIDFQDQQMQWYLLA